MINERIVLMKALRRESSGSEIECPSCRSQRVSLFDAREVPSLEQTKGTIVVAGFIQCRSCNRETDVAASYTEDSDTIYLLR